MEPQSAASMTYALSKLWYAIGGLFGSGALGAFWQPPALASYSKFLKGLIIGGIGTFAPVMVGGFLARLMGLDPYAADTGMAIGTLVGVAALGLFGMAAKFFKNTEDKDILEVYKEVRGVTASKPRARTQAKPKAGAARKQARAGAK